MNIYENHFSNNDNFNNIFYLFNNLKKLGFDTGKSGQILLRDVDYVKVMLYIFDEDFSKDSSPESIHVYNYIVRSFNKFFEIGSRYPGLSYEQAAVFERNLYNSDIF